MACKEETTAIASEYNLLLLGESGGGKSTFLNAFNYYASCDNLEEAKKIEHPVLVPFQYTFKDKNNVQHTVTEGSWSDSETLGGVKSATGYCKSYTFECQDCKVRLIDSAGVGATNGQETDERNIQDVLDFIERFETINAIGIVIKADQTRCSPSFKYCMKQLLTNLDKGAVSNILFIFTWSGNCDYQMGSAKKAFEEILNDLHNEKTAMSLFINDENIFSFDNKWLKYISASRRRFDYRPQEIRACEYAWDESTNEFKRLMDYILGNDCKPGLQPHDLKNIMSINDAKRYIKIINPIFDDILLNVAQNRVNLGKQVKAVNNGKNVSLIPITAIEYKEQAEAKTICVSEKCREEVVIDQRRFYKYPRVCCPGCTVQQTSFRRVFCKKMRVLDGRCKICECHVRNHKRVFYLKEEVVKDLVSDSATDMAENKFNARVTETRKLLLELEKKMQQLEDEAEIIQKAVLLFSHFLQSNTIAPPDQKALEEYRKMDESTKPTHNINNDDLTVTVCVTGPPEGMSRVTPTDVEQMIMQLHSMDIYGPQIQNVYNIQKKGYMKEYQSEESKIRIPKFLKSAYRSMKLYAETAIASFGLTGQSANEFDLDF